MAVTGKGANKLKLDTAGSTAGQVIDAGMRDSSVLCCVDTYTFDAADVANSTIEINTPPVGSRIVDIVLVSTCAVSGLTFDVGDATDPDEYIDAAVGSSASITRMNEVAGFNHIIGSTALDTEMTVTILGATAVGAIQTYVYYTVGESA